MNWLDAQTKELLQKTSDDKLAPSKAAEFALVLLRDGTDFQRLVRAIIEINHCTQADAATLACTSAPLIINLGLTEGEAIWGQFELICCDVVSIFLRSEIAAQNDRSYLEPLFRKVLESCEFKPTKIKITEVPKTESGDKFLEQFLGGSGLQCTFPVTFTVPYKKARIMEHWAARVGAELKLEPPPA